MVEVDRLMIEKYRISLVQMMENAGRGLAILARDHFLDGNPQRKTILVLVGPGGNGGGALVAARRLSNWGADVVLALSHAEKSFKPVPQKQFDTLKIIQLPVIGSDDIKARDFDLIIDGLIGYSLSGAPRGQSAVLISAANENAAPILSLDVPSGLDITSGFANSPTIVANVTLTLALPKQGLSDSKAKPYVGELYCADISVPPQLYAAPSLNIQCPQLFAKSDIIRIE